MKGSTGEGAGACRRAGGDVSLRALAVASILWVAVAIGGCGEPALTCQDDDGAAFEFCHEEVAYRCPADAYDETEAVLLEDCGSVDKTCVLRLAVDTATCE